MKKKKPKNKNLKKVLKKKVIGEKRTPANKKKSIKEPLKQKSTSLNKISHKKNSTPKKVSAPKRKFINPGVYLASIKVVGVGGGGGNILSRMYEDIAVRGIEFIAINSDSQALDYCNAKKKIYIGKNLTRGLGTGMNPDIGRQAAEENRSDIVESLKGADLIFVTAGLGGGSGSGGAPIVAEAAKESGALTIGVVTKPFAFEGAERARIAQEALAKMKEKVDTLLVVPNDKIFSLIKKDTPIIKAFEHIDGVLRSAVEGIAELIASAGIVNVDFADVKAIMKDAGPALVGIGTASGNDRAISAVTQALSSPLLELSIDGARGVLFGVAANKDLKMSEINEVAKLVTASVDPSAKIIFGAYNDRKLRPGQLKITIVATGFNGQVVRSIEPPPSTLFDEDAPKPLEKEEDNNENSDHGETRSEKLEGKDSKSKAEKLRKKDDDSWDIPAFLRRKK